MNRFSECKMDVYPDPESKALELDIIRGKLPIPGPRQEEIGDHFLYDHQRCDWGHVTEETSELNRKALRDNGTVVSYWNVFPTISLIVATNFQSLTTSVYLRKNFNSATLETFRQV